jgi:hypothetical protein
MSLKLANPPETVVVIFSGIEKIYEVLSFDPTTAKPACRVRVGDDVFVGTENEIRAFAADLERGI